MRNNINIKHIFSGKSGINRIGACAVLMCLLCSCSHKAVTVSVPEHEISPECRYYYLEGLCQQNAGHYAAAYDLFRHCLELDSLHADTYFQLSAYELEMKNDSLAENYMEKAVALCPTNDAYHERLAQWYIQSQHYDKAIDAYEQLYSTNHIRTDVLEILVQLYQQEKKYDMMLNTIDRIEQQDGNNESLTLSKVRVYQMKGDKQAAYEALKALSDEHPNDVNYKVMMANWLLQNDRADEAKVIFSQAAIDEPNNEYVAASLYDFYRQQGNDSMMVVYRNRMLENPHTESRTKMTLLQQVISDNERAGGDSIQVLNVFDKTMQSSPKEVDIAQLKAVYMALKKMPQQDIDEANIHVLEIAPDNVTSRLSLVQARWKEEKWDEIIDLCRPALDYNPDEMAFCYFLGLAHYQKNEKQEALEAFKRGVSRINDKSDKEIVSDFYVLMGDILHQDGKKEEAYAAYDSCLQWKPDNIGCLNNYAYFISEDENPDLKRAEFMSLRTVSAEPKNATYLDTYAWILYKQERYLEAQQYIDRAIENLNLEQDNTTVYDHAGDIHLSCDDRKGAVEFWKKALQKAEGDDAVKIKKKIKQNEK